jgi:hypothetical protein
MFNDARAPSEDESDSLRRIFSVVCRESESVGNHENDDFDYDEYENDDFDYDEYDEDTDADLDVMERYMLDYETADMHEKPMP